MPITTRDYPRIITLGHPERLQALDDRRRAKNVEEALRTIAQLYNEKAADFNKRTNEHQTEHDSIRSVLSLVEHTVGPLAEEAVKQRPRSSRLIDLIVYRLYDLTENEIAVVERHTDMDTGARGAEQ